MTDREIVDKAKEFMIKQVVTARRARDFEYPWIETTDDLFKYYKSCKDWISATAMFTQDITKGYNNEIYTFANNCVDEIKKLITELD